MKITEEWLKSVGFRWTEFPRSGGKHWLLWCGATDHLRLSSFEDIGIELAPSTPIETYGWSCWFRSDCSHKYARFIHVRHMFEQADVIALVEAVTGMPWNPDLHLYGSVRLPMDAVRIKHIEGRDDFTITKGNKWAKHESDPSAGIDCRPWEDGKS